MCVEGTATAVEGAATAVNWDGDSRQLGRRQPSIDSATAMQSGRKTLWPAENGRRGARPPRDNEPREALLDFVSRDPAPPPLSPGRVGPPRGAVRTRRAPGRRGPLEGA